jgi:hypothetical protein
MFLPLSKEIADWSKIIQKDRQVNGKNKLS